MPSTHGIRKATAKDAATLEARIAESARALCADDYTPAQIEAALGTAWGLPVELIRDGTYFVAEVDGKIVACGGWSGADSQPGGQSDQLDPGRVARIRAVFVRPGWARRGFGRTLVEHCEAEARARGFAAADLMATLNGERMYAALGYRSDEPVGERLPSGFTITFVPMKKALV